ncbi:MAG TPA: hypothetical protein VGO59_03230 [Verrucomicrobiae bacterium]
MDDLLRAYARKRGGQAEPSPEMPGYTRKLLRDEVKRTFPAAVAPAPLMKAEGWRKWRWPLAAMWGAIAVMVVMFDILNSQMRRLEPLAASNDKSPPAQAAELKAPQEAAKKLTPSALDTRMGKRELAQSDAISSAAAPTKDAVAATPPGPPPPSVVPGGSFIPAPQAGAAVSGTVAAATPLNAGEGPLGRAEAAASAPLSAPGFAGTAQQFVQVPVQAAHAAGASRIPNVLANFSLRRSGQDVSIVDADGSIYKGQVIAPQSNLFDNAKEKAGAPSQAQNAAGWNFNVAGVNRSLRKNVVFNGNVQNAPVAAQASYRQSNARGGGGGGGFGGGFSNAAAAQAGQNRNQSQSQNPFITGQVQIGGSGAFEIEARPPAQ